MGTISYNSLFLEKFLEFLFRKRERIWSFSRNDVLKIHQFFHRRKTLRNLMVLPSYSFLNNTSGSGWQTVFNTLWISANHLMSSTSNSTIPLLDCTMKECSRWCNVWTFIKKTRPISLFSQACWPPWPAIRLLLLLLTIPPYLESYHLYRECRLLENHVQLSQNTWHGERPQEHTTPLADLKWPWRQVQLGTTHVYPQCSKIFAHVRHRRRTNACHCNFCPDHAQKHLKNHITCLV